MDRRPTARKLGVGCVGKFSLLFALYFFTFLIIYYMYQ